MAWPVRMTILQISPTVLAENARYPFRSCFGHVLVLSIATGFGALLWTYHKQDRLVDPEVMDRFGQMYLRNESSFYLWDVWLLSRRFLFCVMQVLLQNQPHVQCITGMVLCFSTAPLLQYSYVLLYSHFLQYSSIAILSTAVSLGACQLLSHPPVHLLFFQQLYARYFGLHCHGQPHCIYLSWTCIP